MAAAATTPNATVKSATPTAPAPDGDAVASTAYATSTALRAIADAPVARLFATPPKHGHGSCRSCARTSTALKPSNSTTATTAGIGDHHPTSATATASST